MELFRFLKIDRYHLLLWVLLLMLSCLHSGVVVQDELTKVFKSARGQTLNGTINLHNPLDQVINIRISQADFVYNALDQNFYIEPGKYERSNADWILVQSLHTIQPRQNLLVPFTIRVPNQRNLSGSYWSVLFVEEDTPFFAPDFEDVMLNFRYAIQIVNNISNTGRVDLAFRETSFTNDTVSIVLHNTGTLWFEAVISVDIFDANATLVGRYTFNRNRVYPELARRFTFPIQPLNRGDYYAIIVVDCGNNLIFGHQVSFTIR